MSRYDEMPRSELEAEISRLEDRINRYREMGLCLNMARGKPSSAQLDISNDIMYAIHKSGDFMSEDGTDCRNYGGLEGIAEMRAVYAEILGVPVKNVILGGNSSLNLMFDFITQGMAKGFSGCEPWLKQGKVKFLCPVPGYDRHFAITEYYGIEMINIDMTPTGPDMDAVERYVNNDASVKGIWCVPMYSNPDGITYSDDTVRRFAALTPAAPDFRIIWDNAYCIHHLYDEQDKLLNLFDECVKRGSEDMLIMLASTSKVSFPGAGVSCIAASDNNIKELKSRISVQTIGPDKVNELRHVRFYKDAEGFARHMKKHAEIIRPKFEATEDILTQKLGGLDIARWTKPRGGYFVSFFAPNGCAKAIVDLCAELGVTLTGAGATYPYGNDPNDSNIRIAPTFPPLEELVTALNVFCDAVKYISAKQALANK